jgi:cell division protein FtsB
MAAARSRRPPVVTLARRWAAVLLVLLIGYAYYHPLRSWLETRHELANRKAEVTRLAAQKRALLERVQASATTDSLAREARRLGYIRPGEHLFIVKGIQAWKKAHATSLGGDGK